MTPLAVLPTVSVTPPRTPVNFDRISMFDSLIVFIIEILVADAARLRRLKKAWCLGDYVEQINKYKDAHLLLCPCLKSGICYW